jgi:hypothetical protein
MEQISGVNLPFATTCIDVHPAVFILNSVFWILNSVSSSYRFQILLNSVFRYAKASSGSLER